MPFQVKTTVATPGQWIQIAEYKPGRTSLWFEFLAGDVIFSPTSNLPMTTMLFRDPVPAGLFYLNKMRDGDINFRLTKDDGDLLEAAWFAWIVPGTVPSESVTTLFEANGTIDVPEGDPDAEIYCAGGGGSTFDSDAVNGATSGAGGGAFSSIVPFDIPPGSTLTINCTANFGPNPIADRADSWVSLTGIAPTNVAEGCLAKSGKNGATPGNFAGGAGGTAAASIGTDKQDGKNGGGAAMFFPGMGAAGGGGGGYATPNGAGSAGGAGNGGANPGGTAGSPEGGTGGASDGSASEGGLAGALGGSGGCAVTPAGVIGVAPICGRAQVLVTIHQNGQYIITTVESFEIIIPPEPEPELSSFSVSLPRLSDSGKLHLQSLMAKLRALTKDAEGGENVQQDPSEYD